LSIKSRMPTGRDTLLTRGIRIHTDLDCLAPQFELLPRVLTRIQTICVPMSPVIPASEVQDMISKMDYSRDAASFVYIFAAVTLNLTRGEPVQEAPATRERIATLLTVTGTITASRGCAASDWLDMSRNRFYQERIVSSSTGKLRISSILPRSSTVVRPQIPSPVFVRRGYSLPEYIPYLSRT
jgi:hypothetical protein